VAVRVALLEPLGSQNRRKRWQAIKTTDFERRQMGALRKELDHKCEAQTDLTKPTSKGASHDQFSSTFRT